MDQKFNAAAADEAAVATARADNAADWANLNASDMMQKLDPKVGRCGFFSGS